MKLKEFKATPLADQVLTELIRLKNKHLLSYDIPDMLSAVYISYRSIEGQSFSEKTEERLDYYVINHNELLKQLLIHFFGIEEEQFRLWSTRRYNKSNPLRLNQVCAMFIPTDATNKHKIH